MLLEAPGTRALSINRSISHWAAVLLRQCTNHDRLRLSGTTRACSVPKTIAEPSEHLTRSKVALYRCHGSLARHFLGNRLCILHLYITANNIFDPSVRRNLILLFTGRIKRRQPATNNGWTLYMHMCSFLMLGLCIRNKDSIIVPAAQK